MDSASPPVGGYSGDLPSFDFFKGSAPHQREVSAPTERPTSGKEDQGKAPSVDAGGHSSTNANATASADAESPEAVEVGVTEGASELTEEDVALAATLSYASGVGVSLASAGLSAESGKVAIGTAGVGVLLYAAGKLTEQEDAARARSMKNFGAGVTVTTAMVQVKRGLLSFWRAHKERSSDTESPDEESPQASPSPEDSAAKTEAATAASKVTTAAASEEAPPEVTSESSPKALEEPAEPETIAEIVTGVLDAEIEPEDLSAEVLLPAANDRPSEDPKNSADEPTPIDDRPEERLGLQDPQQAKAPLDPEADATAHQPTGNRGESLNQASRQQGHDAQLRKHGPTSLMEMSDDELLRELMDPHSTAFAELEGTNRPRAQPLPREIEEAFEWLRRALEQPSG